MRIAREGDEVVVSAPFFRVRFGRTAIASIEDIDRTGLLAGVGVHGWGGHWTVNSRRSPAVRVTLAAPQRGRLFGVPVNVDVLDLAPAVAGDIA